jgi:Flp pilus assembly protein TadG
VFRVSKFPGLRSGLENTYGFLREKSGNIAMTFALLAVPMVATIGASIDYAAAYNTKSKIQADLDAALLSTVKSVGIDDDDAIKEKIAAWFAAQSDLQSGLDSDASDVNLSSTYTLDPDDIDIDGTDHAITATVKASVPTTLLKIAGIDSIPVAAESSVTGTATDYINVYIVLDKSASMLLAATASDQAALIAATAFYTSKNSSSDGCVFACHTSQYSGRSSNYDIAVANGIKLRTDVQLAAVKQVLGLVNTANASKNHVKVGYYTLGTSTSGSSLVATSYKTANGIHTVQTPIYTYSTLNSLLSSSSELSSASSYNSTDFRALSDLASIVGTQGDGSSESSPLKIVMLITDGAQSSMGWVTSTSGQKHITPMNPNWCSGIKTNGATMAVLYTQYLAVTDGDDVDNYEATIGAKMSTSYYSSVWSGSSSALTSTLRRDYIETALSSCASSSEYFIAADSTDEITDGFSSLLTTYLSAVRLTQ